MMIVSLQIAPQVFINQEREEKRELKCHQSTVLAAVSGKSLPEGLQINQQWNQNKGIEASWGPNYRQVTGGQLAASS